MPEISPYLIVPVVTIIVSQVLKFAIHAFSNEVDFARLIQRGGVPSSQIAAVVSVMVTALAVDGVGASVAGLALAMGGLYIWERIGKSARKEAVTGAVVGLVSGVILSVKYWQDSLGWFFDNPADNEVKYQFIFFGALLIVGEILAFMTRRKSMRKLPTSRKLNRAFRLSLTLPAIVGLLFAFAQKETLGMFDIRLWEVLVYVWIIGATIWFWWNVYRHAREHLAEEAVHFKKTKTQEKTKRKKTAKRKRK